MSWDVVSTKPASDWDVLSVEPVNAVGGGRGFVNPAPVKEPVERSRLGVLDAGLSIGSSGLARLAGLTAAGVGAMVPGEDGQAERWLKNTQDALTWAPKSDYGRELMGDLGSGMKKVADSRVGKAFVGGVDAIGEASPVAGAALHSIPDLLGVLGARAPSQAVSDAIKSGASNTALKGAKGLMESSLKATLKQHASGDAKVAVDTLLKYGINPTNKGVNQLGGMIDDVNKQIAESIKNAKGTVSTQKAAAYIDPVRERFANQVSPTADLSAIEKVAADFAQRPDKISLQQAQAIKQGTYRNLKGKYGEEGLAANEAQKAVARGLKDEISAAVPGVSELNAFDSQLIKTLEVAEQRALMDLNKNPVGLSWMAHNPVGFAAYMADKSTLFKSLAARMLYQISGKAEKAKFPKTVTNPKEFNPSMGYGFENTPVAAGVPKPSPLGDLTPEWQTSLGAGKAAPEALDASGLFPALGDDFRTPSRLKSRPQMPMQAGLLGVDDVAIAGQGGTWQKGTPFVDAAQGAPERLAKAPMAVGGIELSRIVNMPKSSQRAKLLNDFKRRYPEAAKYIDENL